MQTAAELLIERQTDLYIETASGKKFFVEHPEFDIQDIAAALSKKCRFGGHTRRFYSVAEHAVLVSTIMEITGGDPFEGLNHDNCEGYVPDVPSPWKAFLPGFKEFEARIDGPLRMWLGLPAKNTEECKRADWVVMFLEAYELMPTKAADWFAPSGIKELAAELRWRFVPQCWTPFEAEHQFLYRFHKLNRDRK